MLTQKELKLVETKTRSKKLLQNKGYNILSRINKNIKDANFSQDNLDNWADYNEWDQYSAWSKN